MTLIRDNISQINVFDLSLTDVHKLVAHVLSNNFLRFGKLYFEQTTGIAMGSRIASPAAYLLYAPSRIVLPLFSDSDSDSSLTLTC